MKDFYCLIAQNDTFLFENATFQKKLPNVLIGGGGENRKQGTRKAKKFNFFSAEKKYFGTIFSSASAKFKLL